MPTSIITSKGQTTLPNSVRKALGLKPKDRLVYIIEDDKVILVPVRGTLLDLRGSVKGVKGAIDFEKVRQETKQKVAQKIVDEGR